MQAGSLRTCRKFIDHYVVQIEITVTVSVVTYAEEVDYYVSAGISGEVDLLLSPVCDGSQVAQQFNRLSTVLRDIYLKAATGRVLAPEGQLCVFVKIYRRSSQYVVVIARVVVRVEAETCTVMTGSMVVPLVSRVGGSTFIVVPARRNTCSETVEVLCERQTEYLALCAEVHHFRPFFIRSTNRLYFDEVNRIRFQTVQFEWHSHVSQVIPSGKRISTIAYIECCLSVSSPAE